MFPIAFGLGGPWDIAIIGAVLIVLFGTSKLAGLGKSMGEGIKEFKKATRDEEDAPVLPPAVPVASSRTEEK